MSLRADTDPSRCVSWHPRPCRAAVNVEVSGVKVERAAEVLSPTLVRLQLALRKDDFVLMNTVAVSRNYLTSFSTHCEAADFVTRTGTSTRMSISYRLWRPSYCSPTSRSTDRATRGRKAD